MSLYIMKMYGFFVKRCLSATYCSFSEKKKASVYVIRTLYMA